MRFWFARDSEVPIREQLVTQVVLGILSGDLAAGHRLPSTREMARRFDLHANTVSAAYRELEKSQWVEARRGSGVYVRDAHPAGGVPSALALDQLIAGFFRSARELGAPLGEVRARLTKWLALQPPDHFLLIEPDEELRRIVMAEVQQAVDFPVRGCGFEVFDTPEKLLGSIPLVLPSKREQVRRALAEGPECVELRVRSVPTSLAAYLPTPKDLLIGVASHWPGFLQSAHTMLIAAGFHRDSIVVRDARKSGWTQGLKQTAVVVCDCVTEAELPKGCKAIRFSILAEESVDELRRHQDFISKPVI